jgi:hypothetical protein
MTTVLDKLRRWGSLLTASMLMTPVIQPITLRLKQEKDLVYVDAYPLILGILILAASLISLRPEYPLQ